MRHNELIKELMEANLFDKIVKVERSREISDGGYGDVMTYKIDVVWGQLEIENPENCEEPKTWEEFTKRKPGWTFVEAYEWRKRQERENRDEAIQKEINRKLAIRRCKEEVQRLFDNCEDDLTS